MDVKNKKQSLPSDNSSAIASRARYVDNRWRPMNMSANQLEAAASHSTSRPASLLSTRKRRLQRIRKSDAFPWQRISRLLVGTSHGYWGKSQTRCSRRRQTSSSVPPPGELDETYVSSLILAYSLHYRKTWRHPTKTRHSLSVFSLSISGCECPFQWSAKWCKSLNVAGWMKQVSHVPPKIWSDWRR